MLRVITRLLYYNCNASLLAYIHIPLIPLPYTISIYSTIKLNWSVSKSNLVQEGTSLGKSHKGNGMCSVYCPFRECRYVVVIIIASVDAI